MAFDPSASSGAKDWKTEILKMQHLKEPVEVAPVLV